MLSSVSVMGTLVRHKVFPSWTLKTLVLFQSQNIQKQKTKTKNKQPLLLQNPQEYENKLGLSWAKLSKLKVIEEVVVEVSSFSCNYSVSSTTIPDGWWWLGGWSDNIKLARACGVPVVTVRPVDRWQWRSGHFSHQSFFSFLLSTVTFSHRKSARIKKLI